MKIELNGKEYLFEVNGTVGPMLMAERLMAEGETFDSKKGLHLAYLFFCVATLCNKDFMTLDAFLGCLTARPFQQMRDYVDRRWTELEGQADSGDGQEGDAGEVGKKN